MKKARKPSKPVKKTTSKIGTLSEKERQYIINNYTTPIDVLSKKLKRSKECIQRVLDSLEKPAEPLNLDYVPPIPIKDLFGRSKNSIVMTPAVSEASSLKKSKKIDESCIFRIK